jgi:hypothetical protein
MNATTRMSESDNLFFVIQDHRKASKAADIAITNGTRNRYAIAEHAW